MERPLSTVMMAAFNAEATVAESVRSALAQSEGRLEVVVVDDGSKIPVSEALGDIRDDRLRIIRHQRNRGLSAAPNTAVKTARAPLVSQLDADDSWEPGYLEAVVPRFEDPAIGLTYTNVSILGHPYGHTNYILDPSVHPMDRFPKVAEQNPVPALTATMRTDAVRRVGGYATWLWAAQDYHLYLRLIAAGWRFAYIDRQLARYRWPSPERGMSYDRRRHELDELKMWLGFVARYPRTPGPRRQVRLRLLREVQRLRRDGRAGP